MKILKRFCSVCGKESEKITCEDCSVVEEKEEKKLRVKICMTCNKHFYQNKLIDKDFIKGKKVKISNIHCLDCKPKKCLAIVQLRDGLEPEVKGFEDYVKHVKKLREGYNIEFTSSSAAFKYVKRAQDRHKVTLKKTSKLLTQRRDGKRVYQPTLLLRKVPFFDTKVFKIGRRFKGDANQEYGYDGQEE